MVFLLSEQIFNMLCLNVAQGQMYGTPSEIQTQQKWFASLDYMNTHLR